MKPDEVFVELIAIVKRLRDPGGCPWDREQTLADMGKYILEEAQEVVDAIQAGGESVSDTEGDGSGGPGGEGASNTGGAATTAPETAENVAEELGDVLFNILHAARIGEETGAFTLEQVLTGVRDKIVRRHPHVFGDATAETTEEVLVHWARIKASEAKAAPETKATGKREKKR